MQKKIKAEESVTFQNIVSVLPAARLIKASTTTTSLFKIKYSLQSLCPQLAKAIRGGYKRKKKIARQANAFDNQQR